MVDLAIQCWKRHERKNPGSQKRALGAKRDGEYHRSNYKRIDMPPDDPNANTAAPPEVPIWRYMDLTRFVAMLASKSLWFSKAALFHDDPWEGFCNVKARFIPPDEHGIGPLSQITPKAGTLTISPARMFGEISHLSASYLQNARDHLYVNSWCLAAESMAMWEIYGHLGCGIAIRSSIGQYRRSVNFSLPKEQFGFDKVHYHDVISIIPELQFDFTETIPLPGPNLWQIVLKTAFHKRSCFQYEQEWRGALYQDARPDNAGCNIGCDFGELINAVYVGPKSDRFFLDVVSSVMEKYDLRKPLEKSALLEPPRTMHP